MPDSGISCQTATAPPVLSGAICCPNTRSPGFGAVPATKLPVGFPLVSNMPPSAAPEVLLYSKMTARSPSVSVVNAGSPPPPEGEGSGPIGPPDVCPAESKS